MESLIKQTRSRFAARQENKEDHSTSTTDRRIQPQKTQSFKEKKRSQSWIRRQFSRQTSSDYDLNGADYPTAVAAAAYAIQSLDDLKFKDQKEAAIGPNKSSNTMKDKAKGTISQPEPLKSALKSSDETLRSSFKNPDQRSEETPVKEPSFKKRISFADNDESTGNKPDKPTPDERASEVGPSFLKRPTTLADKQPSRVYSKKPEAILPKTTPDSAQPVDTKKPITAKLGARDSRADAWEKEEIANITERYVKLRVTIDNWETKKKKRAKRKIERAEAELDKRRAKAMKSHRNKITRIEAIARGAREQADENRKKEVLKAKEKADKIRLTGKIPASCFCF